MTTTSGVSDISASATTSGGLPQGITGAAGPSSDQFLRLLISQLQHQDPLNPLTDQNFTAQLAQFSSLEQLTDINKNLLGLGGIQQDLVNSQALNLLGKSVLVSGDNAVHLKDGHSDSILVDTPASATSVKVQIKNAAGTVVRTITVPPGSGRREVAWDGLDDTGHSLANGDYKLSVDARDASDKVVDATLFLSLTIDGISFADGGVKLASGGHSVTFDQILEIQAH